jgi:Pyruvate/2-oxoacid:ferredoxin oxidoreductase delta subunit/flavodoxin
MKVAIVYFTGTGSTARFSAAIAEGLRAAGSEVALFRMEKVSVSELNTFDLIGLGCPVFSYRAPRIVTRLISEILPEKKTYFIFCTCGGQPGNTLGSLYNTTHKRGGLNIGGIVGKGPNNIRSWRPKMTRPPVSADELRPQDLLDAVKFGQNLSKEFEQITIYNQPEKRIASNPLLSLFNLFFSYDWQMSIAIVGKKFVDLELCTHCGLCATHICPSGAITLSVEKIPQINEKICVGCNGCVNLCPVYAIWSKKTRGKQPYLAYKTFVLNPPK